jgi:quinol monooxygenase YgiN
MSDVISWVLVLTVKDGELDTFQALIPDMVAAAEGEPGTIGYEWFISADRGSIHVHESFTNSDAALAHLGGFGAGFAERFFASVDAAGMYVYGSPSQALVDGLTPMGAEFFGPDGGYSR